MRLLIFIITLFLTATLHLTTSAPVKAESYAATVTYLPNSHTSIDAYHRSAPRISKRLGMKKLEFGAPIFIRIFKQENELELWMRDTSNIYRLYKTYAICHNSGTIGPKLKEGDRQSPEGFYRIGIGQMNPWSKYHLSFNLGYPNEYDKFFDRTGSALMVHGRCSSIGCFAMTDYYMDEIYTLANSALSNGQESFQVHIFPFRLSAENMTAHLNSQWFDFWSNLKEGYDIFERFHRPPRVFVEEGNYVFSDEMNMPYANLSHPSPEAVKVSTQR